MDSYNPWQDYQHSPNIKNPVSAPYTPLKQKKPITPLPTTRQPYDKFATPIKKFQKFYEKPLQFRRNLLIWWVTQIRMQICIDHQNFVAHRTLAEVVSGSFLRFCSWFAWSMGRCHAFLDTWRFIFYVIMMCYWMVCYNMDCIFCITGWIFLVGCW